LIATERTPVKSPGFKRAHSRSQQTSPAEEPDWCKVTSLATAEKSETAKRVKPSRVVCKLRIIGMNVVFSASIEGH